MHSNSDLIVFSPPLVDFQPQVTRQLFREFAKQLTHWLTSNQQKENPETMALLDAILDGLVDPENGSLRSMPLYPCAQMFSHETNCTKAANPPTEPQKTE
jgi:DNA-dependent protein kinase catalytic subunit